MSGSPGDNDFEDRRSAARERMHNEIADGESVDERRSFFEAVYETAGEDAAAVPWADLKPKQVLTDWLDRLPADRPRGRAIDVACGLGDNAEALAGAGFETTAFDFSEHAIAWAKRRFKNSPVDYQVADLFNPPKDWLGGFDLVHECYTVQALTGDLRAPAFAAIAALVAPGGRLLAITRTRPSEAEVDGPPWPLSPSEIAMFETCGLRTVWREDYAIERPDRTIPHSIVEFEKNS